MKMTLVNAERNEYRFEMTNDEASNRIYDCLSKTNPELLPQHIHRSPTAREFIIEYVRSDGMEVKAKLCVSNLKKCFGSRIIKLMPDGLWFIRRLSKKVEIPH